MRVRSRARAARRRRELRDTRLREPRVDIDESRFGDGHVVPHGEHDGVARLHVRRPDEERRADVAELLVGPVVEVVDADAEGVWGVSPRPGDVGGHALGELVGDEDLDRAAVLAGSAWEARCQREKEEQLSMSSRGTRMERLLRCAGGMVS